MFEIMVCQACRSGKHSECEGNENSGVGAEVCSCCGGLSQPQRRRKNTQREEPNSER